MNWSIKEVAKILLVVSVLSVGTVFGVSDVWAQEQGGTLAKQIQGSWILVSATNEQDGKKTEAFGSNPRGQAIYTSDGRFSQMLIRASLPKFVSNNRMKGTVEENQAVVQGSFASFGTYKVENEKEHIVIQHVEGSTFPNWDGQDQKRIITVIGDEMKITIPTSAVGGSNYNIFKRAK
jgi:lipocalin-like protein